MKLSILVGLTLVAQSASAHCKSLSESHERLYDMYSPQTILDIWNTLVAGSTTSMAAVRQPLNNSPVQDVTSNDITCNVSPSPATETVSIAPGSTIGFKLDNTLYHQGPAAIYLGKAPSSAASWDGSGSNWFKVSV